MDYKTLIEGVKEIFKFIVDFIKKVMQFKGGFKKYWNDMTTDPSFDPELPSA